MDSAYISQYLREGKIDVSILKVINPDHFIVKEIPKIDGPSSAAQFAEIEEAMQRYYGTVEQTFGQLPCKETIIVVLKEKKFYRACVKSILETSSQYLVKSYLIDYGEDCTVSRNCVYEIQKRFMQHPFQAVEFKLFDVKPMSLVVNTNNLNVEYGDIDSWDVSAFTFFQNLQTAATFSHIIVKGFKDAIIYGSCYMTINGNKKSLSDALIKEKFACSSIQSFNIIPLQSSTDSIVENKTSSRCSSRSNSTGSASSFRQHSDKQFDKMCMLSKTNLQKRSVKSPESEGACSPDVKSPKSNDAETSINVLEASCSDDSNALTPPAPRPNSHLSRILAVYKKSQASISESAKDRSSPASATDPLSNENGVGKQAIKSPTSTISPVTSLMQAANLTSSSLKEKESRSSEKQNSRERTTSVSSLKNFMMKNKYNPSSNKNAPNIIKNDPPAAIGDPQAIASSSTPTSDYASDWQKNEQKSEEIFNSLPDEKDSDDILEQVLNPHRKIARSESSSSKTSSRYVS